MEISITGQAMAFLGALALGGGLGLLYDLCRLLRHRLPLLGLGAVLDLLYWPIAAVSLFVYAVAAGDGVVRIYFMLGVALGGGIYFLILSGPMVFLGEKLADLAGALAGLCMLPLKWLHNFQKKFYVNLKKVFHYEEKWYRISCKG